MVANSNYLSEPLFHVKSYLKLGDAFKLNKQIFG